jgi:hypothetical protein
MRLAAAARDANMSVLRELHRIASRDAASEWPIRSN